MPSVAIATLGCKVNQTESERMLVQLARIGFKTVAFDERADVYVVNSCTVTSEADHKSRKLARRALKANPSATVVLTGCYAADAKDEGALPAGVHLLEAGRKDELGRFLAKIFGSGSEPAMPPVRARARAMIKIQDGCDNFCSYCIVPHARGGPRSRRAAEVIDEVAGLGREGVREIVLTGINLGRYRDERTDLVELLRLVIAAFPGRVRLSSIEPPDVGDGLVGLLSSEESLCPHLHVPLQSGCDSVLESMGRNYDARYFGRMVERLRAARPEIAITTDVICGFPGESDEQARETLRFLEGLAPAKLHVFKYSSRPHTSAAKLSDQVAPDLKSERARELGALDRSLGEAFAERQVGRTFDILVETAGEEGVFGLSDNYVRCVCEGDKARKGTIVKVVGVRRRGRAVETRIVQGQRRSAVEGVGAAARGRGGADG
ncbi:MAG: tRNA (N(6)-L-threonylcarbamoyladenosine(37)-C(2))-methylthiotransferase MtaB [Actinobacteria bacterium]|nr:MAG: tRNA (N(6)-L-threonylcarbamoyladenosine(37)-C(2))-methylthiotransferase MtaB [Actinomycetota bacterium]